MKVNATKGRKNLQMEVYVSLETILHIPIGLDVLYILLWSASHAGSKIKFRNYWAYNVYSFNFKTC